MSYTAAVITVSDKGYHGQRTDTSGPALCAALKRAGYDVVHTAIIPDEQAQIQTELIRCADELSVCLVLTTGGTGFSPRDVTPEATGAVVQRLTPGLAEAMRAESMRITPRGCLSRGIAGIRGRTLIVNLPGSEKAAQENLQAVMDALPHGLEMLLGSGSADCGAAQPKKKPAPSMDQWLKEAKAHPSAQEIGMYLFHNGVVRATAKAAVREGKADLPPVCALRLSSDKAKLNAAIADTYQLPGVFYVRVWLNEGMLNVGDDMMLLLVGGDIRPHTVDALQYLLSRIKTECVKEEELFATPEG